MIWTRQIGNYCDDMTLRRVNSRFGAGLSWNLAVATLINVPLVAAEWLAQKSLIRGLTFGAII
jgi:ABC-type glycerol-3-phosphate transport system permease component